MIRPLQTYLVIILACCSATLMAQQTYLGYRQGFGIYSMKSLDRLQELRRLETELPLVTTESYPATLNYHVEIGGYQTSFLTKWGICYSFASTGARSTLSDYSGRYDVDAVLNGHQLGLSLEHGIETFYRLDFGAYLEAGAAYSQLKTHDFFNLVYPGHITYQISYDFAALGAYTEAGMFLQCGYRFMMIRLNFGYLVDYMGGLHLNESKDAFITIDNKKIRPQWDGLRMGLQLNLLFRKKEKSN